MKRTLAAILWGVLAGVGATATFWAAPNVPAQSRRADPETDVRIQKRPVAILQDLQTK